MSPLENIGFAFVSLLAVVTLFRTPVAFKGTVFWAWAWLVQLMTALALSMDRPSVGIALGNFFPLFQLVGVLYYTGRDLPAWVLPSGLIVALIQALNVSMGAVLVGAALSTVFELTVFAACIVLLRRSIRRNFSRLVYGGLQLGFALFIGLEIFDAYQELQYGEFHMQWWPYMIISVGLAAVQIIASFEYFERTSTNKVLEREEAKDAAEERFRALVTRSRDIVIEIGPDGRMLYISPNVEKVVGISAEQLEGLNILELANQLELESDQPQTAPDLSAPLEDIAAAGPFGRAYKIKDGFGDVRWIEVDASSYVTSSGDTKAIGVVRDITERRRFEEELISGVKLESLGVLAAGVAHDFNNLLTGLLGEIELSRLSLQKGRSSGLDARLNTAIETVMQAKGLTQQLMTYAGKGTSNPMTLDVGLEIVRNESLFHATLGDEIRFSKHCVPEARPVLIDPVHLQQILLNFLTNAREACEPGGSVALEVFPVARLPDEVLISQKSSGPYTAIQVIDNGGGMLPEIRERIFDPFFSTKRDGRGLGLASVFGIVKMYGGAIATTSKEGAGTTFTVYLPVSTRPVDEQPELALEAPSASQGKVLVVDDTPAALSFTRQALENYRYEVVVAVDGEEALAVTETEHGIDLVLLDLAMPGISGAQLVEALQKRIGAVPIVVMSGYNEAYVTQKLGSVQVAGFLQKPFRISDLLAALEGLLAH